MRLVLLNIIMTVSFVLSFHCAAQLKPMHLDEESSIADQSTYSLIQFDSLNLEDNSEITPRDIVEDNMGFIWMSSSETMLLRFDGYQFKEYSGKNAVEYGLPNQIIRKLLFSTDSNLYVAGSEGIYRFRYELEHFERYISQPTTDLVELSDGKLIALINKNAYFIENGKTIEVKIPKKFEGEILSITKDKNILYLSQEGRNLGWQNGEFFLVEEVSQLDKPLGVINTTLQFEDEVLFGTSNGLFIKNASGSISELNKIMLPSPNVLSIANRNGNEIWIGTDLGLLVISPEGQQRFDTSNYLDFGLKGTYIQKILKNSNGDLLISIHGKGLHRVKSSGSYIKKFTHGTSKNSVPASLVWSIEKQQNDELIIASQNDGVLSFSPQRGVTRTLIEATQGNIWDLKIDHNNNLWIARDNKLVQYRLDGGSYSENQELKIELQHPYVRLFQNKVWFELPNGIIKSIDIDTLKIETYTIPELSDRNFVIFNASDDGQIWIFSNESLYVYKTQEHSLESVQLSKGQLSVTALFEADDKIYIGTVRDGLIIYDKSLKSTVNATDINRYVNGQPVSDITLVNDTLWITTTNSLIAFEIASGKINKFGATELSAEIVEGSLLVLDSNRAVIALGDGIAVISKGTASEMMAPKPTFTGITVYNKHLSQSEMRERSKSSIFTTSGLNLRNNDSPFSIEFAAINSVSIKDIEYRYQLIGLDDNWIETSGSQHAATYTNLGFGNFRFNVQARYPGGNWSQSASLEIDIAPPLWLQPNALIAYSILAAMLTIYWLRQYQVRRQAQIKLRESEERLKMSLWSSGDELWDWHIGSNEVVRSNTWGLIDFPIDNQRNFADGASNIHANDLPRVQKALRAHLKGQSDYYEVTYRIKNKRGQWMWLLDRGKVVMWNDTQPLRMAGTLKNITHLKQSEEQLRLFKRSIETISDGVFITDRRFQYISVNQAYCKITGETRARALASKLNFEQYPENFNLQVRQALQQKGTWKDEIESIRPNGEKFEIELNIDAIYGEDRQITHFVGVFSDISGRKRSEKELLKLANTDTLTNLPNRSFFLASLGNMVRKNKNHVLICLDMDNFKKINDSMGHQVGDQLIGEIARRMQKLAGTNETVYRLGGDEFALLVENNTDMHRITHLAQNVLAEMVRPFTLNNQEFVLGCSVGIAFYPNDGNTPQELLKNADTAMYFAKNAGGNKYQFFSGEMNQNAVRQLQIETLIRHGLKENLFTVFYQPKVDVASGDLVSMEALVRFEHPEKGIISPGQFIPLAEETGQIIDIGERVLLKACTDTQKWVTEGLFKGRVAINLSARQFELADLDERINAILKKTGLHPRYLELEITEGTLMQNPQNALVMMQRLRDMGIHLALDDFGTGYSSLAYLKKFPLNTLKIDKAFIDDIVTSEVDRHMTSAIITIAHNLGLTVVAEGVEDEKQLAILRRYQCEMIQGYLYSKPLNKERFGKLLTESHTMRKLINHSN